MRFVIDDILPDRVFPALFQGLQRGDRRPVAGVPVDAEGEILVGFDQLLQERPGRFVILNKT